jgi:hypothetical protein
LPCLSLAVCTGRYVPAAFTELNPSPADPGTVEFNVEASENEVKAGKLSLNAVKVDASYSASSSWRAFLSFFSRAILRDVSFDADYWLGNHKGCSQFISNACQFG